MPKIKTKGFTLIELMVVIVIIGILVAIALPNFIASQDRAKVSSVKSNVHSFQVMLETYGVDWGGVYPRTPQELSDEAIAKNYNKSYKNPFTGISLNISDSSPGLGLAEFVTTSSVPPTWTYTGTSTITNGNGQVIYRRSIPTESYTRYTLYGLDKNSAFILDKGQVFMISNN